MLYVKVVLLLRNFGIKWRRGRFFFRHYKLYFYEGNRKMLMLEGKSIMGLHTRYTGNKSGLKNSRCTTAESEFDIYVVAILSAKYTVNLMPTTT
jgi:hypothetical protein